MFSEHIILQSAGSLSVAMLALLLVIVQTLFFFRKPQFTWYAWSAAISFSALLYSIGVFLEYNTPLGDLNRFSGLLEWTAIIFLIHCLYGFTFSYLGIASKRYHPVAGVCHGLVLILLWSTNYIVSDSFTVQNFIGLKFPYIEPSLGPLGPLFVLYAAAASVNAMIVWIRHKRTDPNHRITYLVGGTVWILLGIHDGLASLGVPTLQYVMEYGFLGFAVAVLWVVFDNHLERAAEEKYRVITEFANDCTMVIQDGEMVFGNPACCNLLGRPLTDSSPRDFLDIMASEDRKMVLEHYNTLLEGGSVPTPLTIRIQRTDGEQRSVEIASSLIQYRNRPAVLAGLRDITERKKAEEALHASEESYRELANSITDVFFAMDENLKYIYWNKASEELTGVLEKDAIGKSLYELFSDTPETRRAEKIYREALRKQKPMNFVNEYPLKGKRFFFDITAYPSEKGLSVFVKDITDQKKAEEELGKSQEELRNLAAHLQLVREEERTSIAREIHDELGPALTGLKMDLSWLAEKIPKEEPLLDKIQTMKSLTDANINTVRRISAQLRPGMLDILGLVAALEWQAEEFRNRTGVKCKITIEPEEISLDEQLSTDLFRIFQELLTNVARHAQATRVTASFKKKKNYLELTVRDNGKGIAWEQISDPTSFGLIGIRERIHPWKGKVAIKGLANKGTTVTVRVPS